MEGKLNYLRGKIPYDVIIHCIRPFLTQKSTDCLINPPHSIIFLDKEIYNNSVKYLPECREINKINFYGQKVCKKHDKIKYLLINDFMTQKRDNQNSRYLSQFSPPWNTQMDPLGTKYGQYHSQKSLQEDIKKINNEEINLITFRALYAQYEIFNNTPFYIKDVCCGGKGFVYTINE